jgi:hypothetical protein
MPQDESPEVWACANGTAKVYGQPNGSAAKAKVSDTFLESRNAVETQRPGSSGEGKGVRKAKVSDTFVDDEITTSGMAAVHQAAGTITAIKDGLDAVPGYSELNSSGRSTASGQPTPL